ncbi:MAG: hypothetical protein OEU32_06375 [Acidimicrobiia bacterium]|nr:hypothetical protein [Acidimicrobiia bacterium]
MAGEPILFDEVRDALEGFVDPALGELHTRTHRGGIKVWFDDSVREHYEAQWIRGHHLGRPKNLWFLEIGFHAEHSKPAENDALLEHIGDRFRADLGDEPESGEFLGAQNWRRISEIWDTADSEDPDTAMDIAGRLADYIEVIEPLRRD